MAGRTAKRELSSSVIPKDRVRVQVQCALAVLDELYQSVPALGRRRSWKAIEKIAGEDRARRAAGVCWRCGARLRRCAISPMR